jgi:hypothetical protein
MNSTHSDLPSELDKKADAALPKLFTASAATLAYISVINSPKNHGKMDCMRCDLTFVAMRLQHRILTDIIAILLAKMGTEAISGNKALHRLTYDVLSIACEEEEESTEIIRQRLSLLAETYNQALKDREEVRQ